MNKVMKLSAGFFLALVLLCFSFTSAACEIEIKVVGKQKERYLPGDRLTVSVLVILTHNTCPLGIKKTDFELDGLQIEKEEEWFAISDRVYTKDIKLIVKGSKSGKLKFTAKRTCDKEGGKGELILQGIPVEEKQ